LLHILLLLKHVSNTYFHSFHCISTTLEMNEIYALTEEGQITAFAAHLALHAFVCRWSSAAPGSSCSCMSILGKLPIGHA